jgi:hypothetical protein
MRKHGLTVDNLLAADVVTVDGERLRASEELVAARQGERARATEELVRAVRYWSQADADLAELQDAKAKLEAARRE